MHVALFVPCYVDQLYPQVAVATLHLLEQLGCTVSYPQEQTCCGQPMANAGFERYSHETMAHMVGCFKDAEYIVTPSGSCALHIKEHYGGLAQTDEVRHIRAQTYELCTFLHDVLQVDHLEASFPHRVGLHASCHGLRGLGLATPSEEHAPRFDKVRRLLSLVQGLTVVDLARPDECCGFGGTFAISEEALSVKMGRDRLRDHMQHEAEVITGTDMSCLMHLQGLVRRQDLPLRVIHIAEILAGGNI